MDAVGVQPASRVRHERMRTCMHRCAQTAALHTRRFLLTFAHTSRTPCFKEQLLHLLLLLLLLLLHRPLRLLRSNECPHGIINPVSDHKRVLLPDSWDAVLVCLLIHACSAEVTEHAPTNQSLPPPLRTQRRIHARAACIFDRKTHTHTHTLSLVCSLSLSRPHSLIHSFTCCIVPPMTSRSPSSSRSSCFSPPSLGWNINLEKIDQIGRRGF